MADNPLVALTRLGQSIWLDYIQRGILTNGELQRLVNEDAISGVTSNPAILGQAITEHDDYATAIAAVSSRCDTAGALYEALALEDIRGAADLLRSVYERSDARDGYVCFEVAPHLAYDTDATVNEALRQWAALARPNIMIKVPATREGLPAISRLIADGINVNATLIFSADRYHQVALAYFEGLETRCDHGQNIERVASVASFFVSRIDSLADRQLDTLASKAAGCRKAAQGLRGRVAGAAARVAYADFKWLHGERRWQSLAAAGAQLQRILWASTSTKDPAFSDVKYVDDLIAPNTVNTLPLRTLQAYRDHGAPALRLQDGLGQADELIQRLGGLGIEYADLATQLESEGVQKFVDAYEQLLEAIARQQTAAQALGSLSYD